MNRVTRPLPAAAAETRHDSGAPAEGREHRQRTLAATSRLFARLGLDQGLAGHVTARDPEFPGGFWADPLGRRLGRVGVPVLVRVDQDGDVAHGGQPVNRAALAIHAAVLAARPDAAAAARTRSTHGKAWATRRGGRKSGVRRPASRSPWGGTWRPPPRPGRWRIDDAVVAAQRRVSDFFAAARVIPRRHEAPSSFDRGFNGIVFRT